MGFKINRDQMRELIKLERRLGTSPRRNNQSRSESMSTTLERAAKGKAKRENREPKVGVNAPITQSFLDGEHETAPAAKPGKFPGTREPKGDGGKKKTPAGPDVVLADLPTIPLALDELVRHADNRRPTSAAVSEMRASLAAEGLLEPIAVRRLADGRCEILSGETRFLAAEALNWPTMPGRIIPDCDDARALRLMAVFNAKRRDLDPIEKARLIKRLCEPVDQGGGGMTREEAAGVYGLQDGASASNLVKLLELPDDWQGRVASGRCPQSVARLLVPFVEVPRILEAIAADWEKAHKHNADPWDRENWETRERAEETIEAIARETVRPIDKGEYIGYSAEQMGGKHYSSQPRLFKLTPAIEATLGIVELKIGKKKARYATNVAAFDELQIPAVKAAAAKSSRGRAAAAADDDEALIDPKAEARAKAKERAEQFSRRVENWRAWLLRQSIARQLQLETLTGAAESVVELFVMVIPLGSWDLETKYSQSLLEVMPNRSICDACEHWDALKRLQGRGDPDLLKIRAKALAAVLLKEPRDPRFPIVPHDFVDLLAAELSIKVKDVWETLIPEDVATFLELHTSEQLDELAVELGVYVEAGKSKAIKVGLISAKAGALKLPASLGGGTAKPKKKGNESLDGAKVTR